MTLTERPVTLVTGAASGIGAATARLLLDAGHRVAVTGRDAARLEAFTATLPDDDVGRLRVHVADASVQADVERAVADTVTAFGRLDAVVANAGFSTHDDVATGDPDAWRAMLDVNVLGPALLVRAALPHLREARGRIVMVGSVAGIRNTPGNMYSVTKWATRALAENTRLLTVPDGVGVTLVSPGRVDTDFWAGRGGTPSGPVLGPDDVARTIVWTLAQPADVALDEVVVRPLGQL
ncbi:SDR family oxidoreductase [Luteimicrobium sp. NPDC057192]|uniref:SDR family oxidoreductase n=1 Tax=Luteimicrobium sp. NPDC057192 TaxID=3346042 RepID=UPI0036267E2A